MKHDYVVCPACGKTRLVAFTESGYLVWVDYDPKTMEFIQVREGGGKTTGGGKGRGQGRGLGFPKIGSMTLEEAVNAGGKELAVARSLAQRVAMVYAEFKRVGLVK